MRVCCALISFAFAFLSACSKERPPPADAKIETSPHFLEAAEGLAARMSGAMNQLRPQYVTYLKSNTDSNRQMAALLGKTLTDYAKEKGMTIEPITNAREEILKSFRVLPKCPEPQRYLLEALIDMFAPFDATASDFEGVWKDPNASPPLDRVAGQLDQWDKAQRRFVLLLMDAKK